ncbi:MAG: hypothetical protein JSU70_21025 [Phycisphaerales bacterium]|nr:MAG: hypothetical protein JSU70_21025 [Phycisphaerales bacterium]
MEDKRPQELLSKGSISPGGEHAWKMEDVPKVIEAARIVGLANLGGQPQFQGPIGTAEPYWLDFGSTKRKTNEISQQYVDRSATETLTAFHQLCQSTDFEQESSDWSHIKAAKKKGIDPMEHLWFVLYFGDNS